MCLYYCGVLPRPRVGVCRYYTGELVAPVLTLFVAGNHEGAHFLWELPHGGWVAPNIYYLGYASVVRFGGLRIAGLSGIFNDGDFMRGHFEIPPMDERTKNRSVCLRGQEVVVCTTVFQP